MNAMLAQLNGPSFAGPPSVFGLFFLAIFVFVVIRVLMTLVNGVGRLTENAGAPVLTEAANVVAKRSEVTGGRNSTGTTYYATFELSGGRRIEMELSGRQFGMVAEGDRGTLTHQGARFENFARQLVPDSPLIELEPEPPTRKSLSCAYCGNAIPAGQAKCASCGWTWKPKPVESNPVG